MKKVILAALIIAAAPTALLAQVHPTKQKASTEITLLNNKDNLSEDSVFHTLMLNAPQTYNVPAAPRFAIVGKDHKFLLGIGGMAKTTVSYDWGHPIDNAFDFTTSSIPMTQAKGNGGLVQFTAATSGLFINFVALPGTKDQVGVYLNANLTGGNYAFDLQYAYVKYRGITAGYNYSLFSDMAAAPPSIDNEGPCGFTAIPNGVLDYTYSFNSHWGVGIGAEMPMASATCNAETYMVNQRVPDIPAYLQYSWNGGNSWFRFSAIMRNMLYRDEKADKNENATGWGIKVSGSAAASPFITAYWQAAYGKGITSYFQDLYEGGLDLVPDPEKEGRLTTVKTWGGYIGLQYNISPKVYATTTYSHLRNYAPQYAGGATAWSAQYKYAQYALANVIWNITPNISTGIEYLYGRRVNHNGEQAHDNRLQCMLQVNF